MRDEDWSGRGKECVAAGRGGGVWRRRRSHGAADGGAAEVEAAGWKSRFQSESVGSTHFLAPAVQLVPSLD